MTVTIVDEVAAKLKGQTLHLPSLRDLYARWPNEISPHYDQHQKIIDDQISRRITDEHARRKAEKINVAFFSATWYPRSSLDRLETISWYTLWLFLWDDTIEDSAIPQASSESQPSTDKNMKIGWLHQQALRYVKFHLGLVSPRPAEEPAAPTRYCALFKYAAEPLRAACTITERNRLYQLLSSYMECCEVEHGFVSRASLPKLDEYWGHRLGTSGVHTYGALGEYMAGGRIPPRLFKTAEIASLWFETNRQVVIVNDLISLKKEMNKSLHSLVPISLQDTGADLDEVVRSLLETLRISRDNINSAADRLLAMVAKDSAAVARVQNYIGSFQTIATGNYWWSLTCDRYGVTRYIQPDGSLLIPL